MVKDEDTDAIIALALAETVPGTHVLLASHTNACPTIAYTLPAILTLTSKRSSILDNFILANVLVLLK